MRRFPGVLCVVVGLLVHLAPPAHAAEPPALPLAATATAFDGYVGAALAAVQAANPGNRLPFVGKEGILQDTDVLARMGSELRAVLAGLPDARSMAPAALRALLSQIQGPLGLRISPDLRCGTNPCADAAPAKDVTRVSLTLDAGIGSPDGVTCSGAPCPPARKVIGRPFEVGLPGLQFASQDSGGEAIVSWHLKVTVGVDGAGAFVSTANTPELRVGIDVVLPRTLQGTLGVIDVTTDVSGPIGGRGGFHGTFEFDATGGEVRAGSPVAVAVSLTAAADALIRAKATANAALPGIGADLRVHWGWQKPEPPTSTSGLSVRLEDVHVIIGTFLGDALAPIVQGIHDAVAPIAPVAEVLDEPIPGISDVFGDTSLLDLSGRAADATKNATVKSIQQLVAVATKLVLVVNRADGTKISLGEVTLDKTDLLGTGRVDFTTNALQAIRDRCGICDSALKEAIRLIDGGPKLKFPLLDKPEGLVGVLLGNDVELVTFDSGSLKLNNDFSLPDASFAGYGLTVKNPALDLDGYVSLGYDTRGMRRALAGGGSDIADGLWVDGGSSLHLSSPVGIGLSVNFGVVTLGITGGLKLDARAGVRNGVAGQRVRPAGRRLACVFALSGEISAGVGIEISGPLGVGATEIPIAHVTLADFKALDATNCADPDAKPKLAHVEGSQLVLNVGNHRELRGLGFDGKDTDAEKSRVTAERPLASGVRAIRVDVNGYTDVVYSSPLDPITGVEVRATGHAGTQTLFTATEDGRPFDLNVAVYGAQGGNTVTARTDAAHRVSFFGSDGPDRVTTGDADDFVTGAGGDDVLRLGKGRDTGIGGLGNDSIDGGPGVDDLRGEDGDDTLVAGNDASSNRLLGGRGNDQLAGGPGNDLLLGDECGPTFESECVPGYGLDPEAPGIAGGGNDLITGGGGDDVMVAGAGADRMFSASVPAGAGRAAQRVTAFGAGGDDLFVGGPGPDTFYGGPNDDRAVGGGDSDVLVGGAGNDVLGGGAVTGVAIGEGRDFTLAPLGATLQADVVRGGAGNDNLMGGTGADLVEGGAGDDVLDGAEGDDVVIGGSQAPGTPDGADVARGGPGNDIVLGDNGDVVGGTARLYDVVRTVIGGADDLAGGAGSDTVLGGAGDDTLRGDAGDDRLEGGSGSDFVEGGEGQDDVVGGSSSLFLVEATTAEVGDTGDRLLSGGPGHDVIVGDNGNITRGPVVPDDPEAPDRISRIVRFLDSGPDGPIVGGGDRIAGGDGHDVLFGQVGDDVIAGDAGNDDIEGNQGSDTIRGGAGQDDIVGGTTPVALAAGMTTGQFTDGGDALLAGDDGHDVILGDNGSITRGPVVADDPQAPDRFSRRVVALDGGPNGPVVGAGDRIDGGGGHDRLFGQVGDDVIAGGDGNDEMEGNDGADILDGGAGEDDVVGGTTPGALAAGSTTAGFADAGDTVAGGEGHDLLVGDNAVIGHLLGADGTWERSPADGRYLRTVTLADRTTVGAADVLLGGDGNDDAFGGLGDDRLHGGAGQDYLEGNQGADTIDGSAGDDDIVGGTSPIGVGGDERVAGSAPDGADVIHGRAGDEPGQIPPSGIAVGVSTVLDGDGLAVSVSVRYGPIPEPAPGTETDGDVVAGDNARIDRCRPGGFLVRQWAGRQRCAWSTWSLGFYGPTVRRWVQQLGQPVLGLGLVDEILPDGHSGNDVIHGDDGDDLLLGQGGFDTMHGGMGDDVLYGGIGLFNRLYGGGGGVDVVITPPDLSLLALLGVH